jgi:hypothetical protein
MPVTLSRVHRVHMWHCFILASYCRRQCSRMSPMIVAPAYLPLRHSQPRSVHAQATPGFLLSGRDLKKPLFDVASCISIMSRSRWLLISDHQMVRDSLTLLAGLPGDGQGVTLFSIQDACRACMPPRPRRTLICAGRFPCSGTLREVSRA